jgi:hypothetical protein
VAAKRPGGVLQRAQNRLHHVVDVRVDIVVPDAQDAKTGGAELCITDSVAGGLKPPSVLAAIHFNDHAPRMARKVDM